MNFCCFAWNIVFEVLIFNLFTAAITMFPLLSMFVYYASHDVLLVVLVRVPVMPSGELYISGSS